MLAVKIRVWLVEHALYLATNVKMDRLSARLRNVPGDASETGGLLPMYSSLLSRLIMLMNCSNMMGRTHGHWESA